MKKKIIISVSVILVVIVAIIGVIRWINSRNPKEKIEEIVAKPFVEENNIQILSTEDEYKLPVEPFAVDENNNIVNVDGFNLEKSTATFKFYDFDVSEEDENGYVVYSFKYDLEVPITFTVDLSKTNPYWRYNFSIPDLIKFDYYTGEIYKDKTIGLNDYNTYNIGSTEDMNYTDISWNNKTYKIGVRTESKSKWDGYEEVQTVDRIKTFLDTYRATMSVFISTPKGYNGLMGAFHKAGASLSDFLAEKESYNNYINEQKDDTDEEKQNTTMTVFDCNYDPEIKYSKDDLYVIKLTDIKPKENN